jgi:hypothetical protein
VAGDEGERRDSVMQARLARPWVVAGLALLGLASRCVSESGSRSSPESSKIRISQPTTDPRTSVGSSSIDLAGWASIDAWKYYEVEPKVRWIDVTSGMSGSAQEHVDWEWFFFTLYPRNHTWSATVPLVPGWNDIRVEAYYSTSGTVVGSDSIQVERR